MLGTEIQKSLAHIASASGALDLRVEDSDDHPSFGMSKYRSDEEMRVSVRSAKLAQELVLDLLRCLGV